MASQAVFFVALTLLVGIGAAFGKSYTIDVHTGDRDYAATDASVHLQIFGSAASTPELLLSGRNLFNRASKDVFKLTTADLGQLQKIKIRHDNSWWGPGWFLDKVVISDDDSNAFYEFACYRWLSTSDDDGEIERTIQVRLTGSCGLRTTSRIVNGNTTKPNSWPWQAQLAYKRYRHVCGGSLVHPQWVVTAAHCVEDDLAPSAYKVTLGEHHLINNDGTEQVFGVQKIIMHHAYDTSEIDNDIALMKLDRPALLSKAVGLVCLPDQGDSVPAGTNCIVSGWGDLYGGGPTPDKLQEATLPTVSNDVCKKGNAIIGAVTKNMLCAGAGGTNNVASCHGDSGGPFVCPEGGKWKLRGVVSWGESRCIPGTTYDVFARVSMFSNWILGRISTE